MGFLDKISATFENLFPVEQPEPYVSESEQLWIASTGSNYTNSASSGSKFPGALSSRSEPLVLNNAEIRRNVRNAMHDSVQARAIVDRFTDSIVDTGLKTEFTPKWRQLGIPESAANEWARDHEERFDLFMQSKHIDRTESQTGYQLQRMAGLFQQRDNDAFIRFYYSKDKNLISPLQISFVDPNQIRSDALTSIDGAYFQRDGVITNSAGKPTAYQTWYTDNNGVQKSLDVPAVFPRSKRISMVHMFRPEYAGQRRGYSRLAHALTEFEKLTDFSLAKIQAAINQTNIIGYVKPSLDAPSSNPFEGVQNSGPIMGLVDTGATPTIAGVDNAISFKDIPEATQTRPGSFTMASLASGEELQFMSHNIQGDSYDAFVNTFTGYLAASVGMSIETLLIKFGNSYSASRAALVIFWRNCLIWRQELDADMMSPIIEAWISEEIAAGRTQAPGWSDPRMKQAWMSHNLYGAPMPSIDPGKDAKADKDNLEINITTQERIARERNGSSARDNMSKNEEMFKKTPIPPWAAVAVASAGAETENDKKE